MQIHKFIELAGEAVRYGIVGIAQNAFFLTLTLGIVALGAQAWVTISFVYPLAAVVSFLLHRNFSFRKQAASGQFRKYIFALAAGYGFAVGFTALQESVGIPSWLAAIVTTLVAAAINFAVMKLWVFAEKKSEIA